MKATRENGENNNGSNQQKSNFARAVHFFCSFLCRCFERLQCETSRNFLVPCFMEGMSYVLSFTFFSLPLIFTLHWWLLAFLIFSPPLQNFHVVLPTKKCLLCFFISCSTYLSPFFSMNFAGSMGSTITTLFSSTSCMHQ